MGESQPPPERARYELHPPLIITSRLLGGMRIEGAGTVHVEPLHRDEEGRVVYRWIVDDNEGHELGRGEDLRTGVADDVDHREVICTLLSFLATCGESRRMDGENADLFDEPVGSWCEEHQDEIDLAFTELYES